MAVIHSEKLAEDALSTPFDPLIAVRLHSSTQYKKRLSGNRGLAIVRGNRTFYNHFRCLDSLSLEEYELHNWPELLNQERGTHEEPLNTAERVPIEVFREIRKIRGQQVVLTRELLRHAADLGYEKAICEPISPSVREQWIHDSWGPLASAPVLEAFRKAGLLSSFAENLDENEGSFEVLKALFEAHESVRTKLHLADDEVLVKGLPQ